MDYGDEEGQMGDEGPMDADEMEEVDERDDDDEDEEYEDDDQMSDGGNLTNISSQNIEVANFGNPNLNKKIRKRRSLVEQTHDLRILLNKIFGMRGGWKITNLAMDFSDGFLFQELFNILYDEKLDCCLEGVKSAPNAKIPYEQKVGNWNKINAGICFNYFQ